MPSEPALGELAPRVCETALDRLLDRGLYVALEPYGAHLLRIERP